MSLRMIKDVIKCPLEAGGRLRLAHWTPRSGRPHSTLAGGALSVDCRSVHIESVDNRRVRLNAGSNGGKQGAIAAVSEQRARSLLSIFTTAPSAGASKLPEEVLSNMEAPKLTTESARC